MRRLSVAVLALTACSGPDKSPASSEPVSDSAASTEPVSWNRDIRPLVVRSCAGCHTEGQIGPFSFEDWATVSALAPAIVASVEDGSMPPYAFDQDCRETAEQLHLTAAEIELFKAWREADYPEGDAEDYLPPDMPARVELPPIDVEVRPLDALEVDLTKSDDYRCLVSDTVFETDTWLVGEQALIDHDEIVHHLIYYTVPAASDAALLALDAETEAPGIPCYEPAGYDFWSLPGLDTFGGWAPGFPTRYQGPETGKPVAGIFVEAGSRIVIEGHFNSMSTDEEAMVDRSGLGLWTLPAGELPDVVLQGAEVSDYRLDIPAGASDHVEGGSLTLRSAHTLVSVSPHMHNLATRMEATLVRADGRTECLTRVDPYDFNWQWNYTYAEPVRLEPGDRIDMTCHYDNTAGNQPLVDGVPQEPRDVSYGDGTTDEMCIHYMTYELPYAEWAADR